MNGESTPPMVKEREGGIAVPHPSSCVDVAAAVITRSDGSFLLGERPEGKVYAGYWEFPGGKIEASETPLQGLARELHEELGIDLTTGYPWLTQVFTYPHATVRLHFFRVTAWRGEAHGRENQRLVWQRAEEPPLQPMLPANTPIFRALRLPAVYAITHAAELGEAPFLVRLEAALDKGLRLVQMREKSLRLEDAERFARLVVARCRHHAASVLINGDMELARAVAADGVHLTARQLMQLGARPDFPLVGASCHDTEELAKAAALGLDFVVLGPVLPTKSHPMVAHLGWDKFTTFCRNYSLPVYALGGLSNDELKTSWRHGAHGIAMQRAIWSCGGS